MQIKKYKDKTVKVKIDGKPVVMALTRIEIVRVVKVNGLNTFSLYLRGLAKCDGIAKVKYFTIEVLKIPTAKKLKELIDAAVKFLIIGYNKDAGVYDRIAEEYRKKTNTCDVD